MKTPKYVYIISNGGAFKVGVASNPENRLKQLQTANSSTLVLEHAEIKDNPYKVEGVVHRSLREYRTNGEWFEGLTLTDVRVALMLCTEYD